MKKNILGKFEKINDFSDIENDEFVIKWLENIKSKKSRISIMKKFCDFIEKSPSEIAHEHQEDLKKDVLKRTKIAKNQMNAFFGYLTGTEDKKWKNTLNKKVIKKPLAWNSAIQYVYSRLLSFYKRLGIPVVYGSKTDKPMKSDINIREKTWRDKDLNLISVQNSKEYLKQMRDSFNSLRDKSIFLSKLSSGLDDVDLFNLKVRDFNRGYSNNKICYLQGNRQKDGIIYQTFFGYESCVMINLYLQNRLMKLQKIDDSIEKLDENGYLFVVKKKNKEIKLNTQYYSEKMHFVVNQLGLSNITPKGLRRWFGSILSTNAINLGNIKRLMGQKVDQLGDAYIMMFQQAKEGDYTELSDYFLENIDTLISLGNGNGRITKVTEKLNKLEDENKEMKEENKELKNKMNNIMKFLESKFSDVSMLMTEKKESEEPELDYTPSSEDIEDSIKNTKKK